MKKIGIDISMLVYQGSGVANYTYNLVKHVLLIDKENEYRLFYSSFRRPKHFYYLEEFRKLGAKVYSFPFPPRILQFMWNTHHLFPIEWLIGKVDYFFSSDYLRPPLLHGTKGITTIHDITWKLFPEFHTPDVIIEHEKKMKRTIQYHDHIIVDSLNTKNDLVSHYPPILETNTVSVLYPGVGDEFVIINNRKKIQNILHKYHLIYPKRYLLYVGAIEPRKNLTTAIVVYNTLIKDKRFSDYEFVIVGRAGWKNNSVFQTIKQLHLQQKVHIVGFVEDADVPYFYNACQVCIYLSHYEGFGLPPVEAAQCGKFTLLYNVSSLGELFSNDYEYANEGNEVKTLKSLLLSKKNVKQYGKSFLWKDAAHQFISLII